MTFFDELQNNLNDISNLQLTENGAIGYKSTGKTLLDMNFSIPKYRNTSDAEIAEIYNKAYSENPLYAILWAFFARDIRGGLGERRLFRVLFHNLCVINPTVARETAKFVSEYGRWDDLIYSTDNTEIWNDAVNIIKEQLLTDTANMKIGKPITLLGKWLPSERTSSQKARKMARKLARAMGIPIKSYNKMLVALRGYSNVVETKMSAKEWKAIDYSTVPTYANLKYNNAFLRNDEERRRAYLNALTNGETKINASTAFPHDIVRKYINRAVDTTLEEMWKALPDMGGLENVMVVSDGSGSMTWGQNNGARPLDVAHALSIYCSEHCKGEFKDKYITFSACPQLVDLSKCNTLLDKLNVAKKHDDCTNTNIEAVFDIILDTAIQSKATQEDIPQTVLIISDMEFDNCVGSYSGDSHTDIWGYYRRDGYMRADSALFNVIKKRFEKAGYKMPRIVFWNVASRTGTIPMKENELGVTLVSGYSVSIFKMVANGETDPYMNLVKTITSERYQPIIDAIKSLIE